MSRVSNWEEYFYPALDAVRQKPFCWGQHDCALFAADMIEIITGTDLAADFRGLYSTEKGSLKALKQAGFDSIEALADSLLTPVPVLQAKRGDLVLIQIKGKAFFGIATGTVAVAPGKTGLMQVNLKHWTKAWSV